MSSPLNKLKNGSVTPAVPAPVATQTSSPLANAMPTMKPPAVQSASPLSQMVKTSGASLELRNQFSLPVTATEVEQMGKDVSRQVSTTTDKITQKFTTASFGELGDMLYKVQSQASNLHADDLMNSGVIGWIRRKGADIKAVLTKRFQTAQAAFDELEGKLTNQHTLLEDWEKDMETLYNENYQNYMQLRELLQKAEMAYAQNEAALLNFPVISPEDPDAFMKAQLLEEARAQQNDVHIACDTYRRKITMCEHNGPDLRSRIRQSNAQRKAIRRVIGEVIPLVEREFAKFIQTLEMQKAITIVDGARDMGDQALRISADSSKDAAIASAKSTNAPVISTSTINHIRTRAIEALQEVQRIEQDAKQERDQFAIENQEAQAKYLQQLQQHKAV